MLVETVNALFLKSERGVHLGPVATFQPKMNLLFPHFWLVFPLALVGLSLDFILNIYCILYLLINGRGLEKDLDRVQPPPTKPRVWKEGPFIRILAPWDIQGRKGDNGDWLSEGSNFQKSRHLSREKKNGLLTHCFPWIEMCLNFIKISKVWAPLT